MGRKQPYTPNSRIRSALRQLYLRSRERQAALKRDKYTCSCGRKQSRAKGKECKVQVHHIDGEVDWDSIILFVRKTLLVPPELLETLCEECHEDRHPRRRKA